MPGWGLLPEPSGEGHESPPLDAVHTDPSTDQQASSWVEAKEILMQGTRKEAVTALSLEAMRRGRHEEGESISAKADMQVLPRGIQQTKATSWKQRNMGGC